MADLLESKVKVVVRERKSAFSPFLMQLLFFVGFLGLLLIEEIIEMAYLVKTEQEESQERSAAALLMSIREQLRVLAEKKKDIANFDHEAELIALLRDRICSFSGLYQERDELFRGIGEIYLTLDAARAKKEETLQRLQDAVDQAEELTTASRARVEVLKTSKKETELEALLRPQDYVGRCVQQVDALLRKYRAAYGEEAVRDTEISV